MHVDREKYMMYLLSPKNWFWNAGIILNVQSSRAQTSVLIIMQSNMSKFSQANT